jgi:glycerol uptake facilitator-like aquaporin
VVQPPADLTCFFERDPAYPLWRRALAEALGTSLLMLAATGAGLTAQRLTTHEPGVGAVIGAFGVAAPLVALIIAFGATSGGHFNPLITALQWMTGERSLRCAVAYIPSQCLGAIAGALLATGAFAVQAPTAAAPMSFNFRLTVSEVIASACLLTIVFACARSGRRDTGPFAVGAWLFTAIIATPSTSYANPAIAVAALFARGPITLSVPQLLAYVPAEILGALIALVLISAVIPLTTVGRTGKRPIGEESLTA